MIPARRDSLAARVQRIERAVAKPLPVDQPLSGTELRELRMLEHERDRQFPRPIDDMDQHELNTFLAYCGGHTAARLSHLRERNRSPAELAEGRAMTVAIEAMGLDRLLEFMDEMALCSPEPRLACPADGLAAAPQR